MGPRNAAVREEAENEGKSDSSSLGSFSRMQRNATSVYDLAHWCRVFKNLGVQVEEECAANVHEMDIELSDRQKILQHLRSINIPKVPQLPVFYAGYLRNLNRGGEMAYYVLDSQALVCYTDSSRANAIARYALKDVMSIQVVNGEDMRKRVFKMKKLIADSFDEMVDDGIFDVVLGENEDIFANLSWEAKLMLILQDYIQSDEVADRLLGAFGLDKMLLGTANMGWDVGSGASFGMSGYLTTGNTLVAGVDSQGTNKGSSSVFGGSRVGTSSVGGDHAALSPSTSAQALNGTAVDPPVGKDGFVSEGGNTSPSGGENGNGLAARGDAIGGSKAPSIAATFHPPADENEKPIISVSDLYKRIRRASVLARKGGDMQAATEFGQGVPLPKKSSLFDGSAAALLDDDLLRLHGKDPEKLSLKKRHPIRPRDMSHLRVVRHTQKNAHPLRVNDSFLPAPYSGGKAALPPREKVRASCWSAVRGAARCSFYGVGSSP